MTLEECRVATQNLTSMEFETWCAENLRIGDFVLLGNKHRGTILASNWRGKVRYFWVLSDSLNATPQTLTVHSFNFF
jgi:predicted RNA-binding protein (virulence factor B family)